MCGIAGYIGRKPVDESRIALTLGAMKNRGPDHRDWCSFLKGDLRTVLLHSRLGIIDLDARSNQPFTIGDYSLVYNGEIYNYLELREELERSGVVFTTDSDTEVLLRAYLEYGEACVEKFEGMWSFAIHDRRSGGLFLSRDRFAEKPLYWLRTADGIYFGSEVKFIGALSGIALSVNPRQILRYLVNGYKSLYKHGETFYRDIGELPYATNMRIMPDLTVNCRRYWEPRCSIDPAMTLDDAVEGARHFLTESMRLRLRSDVPLAFCLSGGVDSAALTSIAAREFNYDVHTFSIIEKDERYNEYDNIMATIEDIGCRHRLIGIPDEDPLPRLRRLIAYHDAPLATISYYVHSLISEEIARSGFRVAFSGTSADELFTGYYDHYLLHLQEMRGNGQYGRYLSDWQEQVARFIRNPLLKDPNLYEENPGYREHVYDDSSLWVRYITADFYDPFREEIFCDSLLRNRMMNELFHEATPVILHEDDLNSMLFSVENRSPYLDSRLFAFAYSIPAEHLIREGYNKYVLRQAVRGTLNDKVRLDRQKKGFNASIHSLVDFDRKEVRDELLAEGPIFDYVNRDMMERLFDEKPTANSASKFLFNFINARIFLDLN